MINETRNTIEGFKVLLADDFSSRREIEESVKEEIADLELLNDEESVQAVNLYKQFLLDCEKHAKKLSKLQLKETIYEDALKGATSDFQRDFVLKKLEEIDKDKKIFS